VDDGVRFGVLGPLRVHAGGGEVLITAPRERVLLAMLLLRAGEPVPAERLVEAVWGDTPPRTAYNGIQACVSRLRRRFAGAGFPARIIGRDPAGYRALVDPDQVDLHRFRALTGRARDAVASGRRMETRDRYREAAELWRGPALAGVDSELVRREAATLEDERVRALEERVEVELALGRGGELAGELTDLLPAHPYREGLHAALMRALYRAGRHADALEAFRTAGRLLREELATEPGDELHRLHKAILNRDPALDVGAAQPLVVGPPSGAVPRDLPAEASCFVGRDQEAARVRQRLLPAGSARRRPAVVVLYGPGGVGKSALAVRVAHELSEAYPDGQLYVDLCGSTPGCGRCRRWRCWAGSCAGSGWRRTGSRPVRRRPARCSAA
jgi:DNA-binding SARP family transcriptional activator